MQSKFLIIFLLLISSVSSYGSKLEKGFEALNQLDYFKAKEYFEKTMEKEPAGSAFGMSKIYSAKKSQFYDVDKAFEFILIADSSYKLLSDKEMIELNGYDVTEASIRRVKVYLAITYFERATEINTVEGYQNFIDEHPNGEDVEEAEKLRNHLAYLKAVETNVMEDYALFMKNYPNALDYASAKKKFQLLEYEKLTREGDAFSYQAFIKHKPENPYTDDAQEVVYEIYTKDKTSDSYEKFIAENPDNKNIELAWKSLFKLRTSKFTPASISEFMIDYPAYPDYNSLKEDLLLSQTILIPAKMGDLWGYVDTLGAWQIKPKFSWASHFTEGKALVGFFGKTVFVNKRGGLVFSYLFDDAALFNNDLAVVEMEEKMGVINFLGDTVIPITYDEIGVFSEGLIYAGIDDKYGYFDEAGKEIVPFVYESAFDFVNNKAIVKSKGKYGVINMVGQQLVPPVYEYIYLDSNGFVAKHGDVFGLISYAGDTLMPFEYSAISTFSNNRAIAVKGDKYQYVNQQGKVVINSSFPYDETTMNFSAFKNGYARVKSNGKVGVIDTEGESIFPAIFMDVGYYNPLLTPIRKLDKWGFADENVDLKIPYMYNYAYNFVDGYAIVENDSTQALINKMNEEIIPFGYNEITVIDSNYIYVKKGDFVGLLNFNNEILVPVEYDKMENYNDEELTFTKDNKTHIYWLKTGKWIYKDE